MLLNKVLVFQNKVVILPRSCRGHRSRIGLRTSPSEFRIQIRILLALLKKATSLLTNVYTYSSHTTVTDLSDWMLFLNKVSPYVLHMCVSFWLQVGHIWFKNTLWTYTVSQRSFWLLLVWLEDS